VDNSKISIKYSSAQDGGEEGVEVAGRYNLSPEYQHVQSKFRDTQTAVDKLRLQAEDKREELREERRRNDEARLPTLAEREKKPNSTRKQGRTAQNQNIPPPSQEPQMIILSPKANHNNTFYSSRSPNPTSAGQRKEDQANTATPGRSQRAAKKREAQERADQAADRLYLDAEARRAREERARKANRNGYKVFDYDKALRGGKPAASERNRAKEEQVKKSSRAVAGSGQASGRDPFQATAQSRKQSAQNIASPSIAGPSKQSLPPADNSRPDESDAPSNKNSVDR